MFVLYKFTSFFSYVYNFTRLCGKVFHGFKYIACQLYGYIRQKQGYIRLGDETEHEYLLPEQSSTPTIASRVSGALQYAYHVCYKLFTGKNHPKVQTTPIIPLYETTMDRSNLDISRGLGVTESLDQKMFAESRKFNEFASIPFASHFVFKKPTNESIHKPPGDCSANLMESDFINAKIKYTLPFRQTSHSTADYDLNKSLYQDTKEQSDTMSNIEDKSDTMSKDQSDTDEQY